MGGPSNPPEPSTNAYRKDLADLRLAGRVIASHYVEASPRRVKQATQLRAAPSSDSPVIATLADGDSFELLDDTSGWAWGYGGEDRKVGYVVSSAIAS